MIGLPSVTIVGTLTADPEMRFIPSGVAVTNFTVAANDRKKTPAGEWVDGDATFLRCNVWRQAAENVVESLTKGTRVVVIGNLKQRSYETSSGEKRTVMELEVEEVAASVKWATVTVNRATRSSQASPPAKQVDDPWGTPPSADPAPF